MHAVTRYTFTIRDCDTAWIVRKVDLHESLSQPYTLTLELLTSDLDLPPQALLGAACRLTLAHSPGPARDVHGLILRVDTLDHDDHLRHLRLEIGPALALHAHQINTRLWQHTSVPDIIKDVLEDSLTAHGRRLRLDLAASYPPRATCTQYRESDLEFVQRLLHDEGIAFTFDHDDDAEILVLLDDNTRCPLIGDLPFVPRGGDTTEAETLESLAPTRALGVTSLLQRDWSPLHAADAPFEHARLAHDDRGRGRLVFDHDDQRTDQDDGDVRARRKLEQRTLLATAAHGRSTALALAPGRRFDLTGHPDPSRDGRHVILHIDHHGEVPDADQLATYHNTFTCIPDATKLRPPHSPHLRRPRIPGPHTAIVVGPEGEEIHTDEHGRIRVRFHWDRSLRRGDDCSCWVPVAQTWAGPGWGALFLPRVGMEVVVQFLDGDPDRPLVVGCVYNSLHRPPVPLPEQKTRSALTSESTPGGGLANQIQFEDARNKESLTIHTRRNLHTRAGHDHTADIDHDLITTVGQNQTTDVGANQVTTVIGNCDLTIADGDLTTTVVSGNRDTTIHGNDTTSVVTGHSRHHTKFGTHLIQARQDLGLKSELCDIMLNAHGSVSIDATTASLSLTSRGKADLHSLASAIKLRAKTNIDLEADEGDIIAHAQRTT
jgi:type VI secretion system secreted protein VgrG